MRTSFIRVVVFLPKFALCNLVFFVFSYFRDWAIMFNFCLFFVFLLSLSAANADTPANCTLDDLLGTWHVYVYSGGHDKTLQCDDPGT